MKKKISEIFIVLLSLCLIFSGGVFAADDSGSELVYGEDNFFYGHKAESNLGIDHNVSPMLLVAFNDSTGATSAVDIMQATGTAWDQHGNPVEPLSDDAVVLYDNATNTLTLAGYHYEGPGYHLEQDKLSTFIGIYAYGMGDLNIKVVKNSSINLTGIAYTPAHSMGILGNTDTTLINIIGNADTQLTVRHGQPYANCIGSAIYSYNALSVSTAPDSGENPFKLICQGTDETSERNCDYFGLYTNHGDMTLTSVELDIEDFSVIEAYSSIGIAAGGETNGITINDCTGIVKGGVGATHSEAIHCGSLDPFVPSNRNLLQIKDSALEIKSGQAMNSSCVMGVNRCVIDGSKLTLKAGDAPLSNAISQNSKEKSKIAFKNQADVTLFGKNGAIACGSKEPKELDFSEYGENLKVKAGASEAEAVLKDNPQDCVGSAYAFVHIFARKDAPKETLKPTTEPTPEKPDGKSVNTGLQTTDTTMPTAIGLLLAALLIAGLFVWKQRRAVK